MSRFVSNKYWKQSQPFRTKKYDAKALVESDGDVNFWDDVFKRYAPQLKIWVTANKGDATDGKTAVLNHIDEACPTYLLCVDSDYDYLLQGKTERSKLINGNDYVFQTYTYSIENYRCYAPSLGDLCLKASALHDVDDKFDFVGFLRDYSRAVYLLFLYSFHFRSLNANETLSCTELEGELALDKDILEKQGMDSTLLDLQEKIRTKINKIKAANPNVNVCSIARSLRKLKLKMSDTYLFICGHVFFEKVAFVIVKNVTEDYRSKRRQEINAVFPEGKARRDKLGSYSNLIARCDFKTMLENNTGYHDCFLMDKIKRDVEKYVEIF